MPIVSALEAVAVTVTEPPRLTEEPLIVIALLVSALFGKLVNVFEEPLIDLFVNVCELSVSTNVLLAGIVVPFKTVVELLDSVVNAPVEAVEAPIVVPLIAPPVIAMALAFCVDMVPKPVMAVLGIVVLAVMVLVPLPYT